MNCLIGNCLLAYLLTVAGAMLIGLLLRKCFSAWTKR